MFFKDGMRKETLLRNSTTPEITNSDPILTLRKYLKCFDSLFCVFGEDKKEIENYKIFLPVNVLVFIIPSIDLILLTTISPSFSKSSASILAIRSYSPKRGSNSIISDTLESLLYTSCSCAGAAIMST